MSEHPSPQPGASGPAPAPDNRSNAEWWDLPVPPAPRSAPDSVDPNAEPLHHASGQVPPPDEESLRLKAKRPAPGRPALRNPLDALDRRSGDLEGLVRLRGPADEVVPPPPKKSLLWPSVGALAVLSAAAAAVGIPIWLNKLEMDRLARELAANPLTARPAPPALEDTDLALSNATPPDAEPAQHHPDSPSPAASEANQSPLLALLEHADEAAASGNLSAIQAAVTEALDVAADRPDALLMTAAALGTASPSLSPQARAALRSVLRPLYEQAAKSGAGIPEILQRCADFFAANGETALAEDLYNRASALPSSAATASSRPLNTPASPAETLAALEKMASREPDNPAVRSNLARLLLAENQPEKALPHIEAARAALPDNPALFLQHLSALADLELWKTLRDEIAAAPASLRDKPLTKYFAAQAEFRLGNQALAMDMFRELASLSPPGAPELAPGLFFYTYGVAALLSGDKQLALSLFEKALLPGNPAYAAACNNLAWLLVTTGSDPDRAVRLAQNAASREPSNPAFADTLARALLAAGRYDAALDRARAAIRLTEGRPEGEMFETLGDALLKTGNKNEARKAYEQALATGVPHPQKIQAKLNGL